MSGGYECASCGESFRSLRGFDGHREGPMDARRCLRPDEIVDRLGLVRDPQGVWTAGDGRGRPTTYGRVDPLKGRFPVQGPRNEPRSAPSGTPTPTRAGAGL